jgi:hypothetical protein
MSSRTSSGKKKNKRSISEFASTPFKPQVVKVEFAPFSPQVIEQKKDKRTQQTVEPTEPQQTNWNVVGIFSALFPLIGTGILFMMGWAYEVNWYGYFGVNASQVNSPAQSILIQSIPALIIFLSDFFFAIISYFLGASIYTYFNRIIRKGITKNKSFIANNPDGSQESYFKIKNWLFVGLLTEIYLLFYLYTYYPEIFLAFPFGTLGKPYEISYLMYLFLYGALAFMVTLFFYIIFFAIIFIFVSVFLFIKRKFSEAVSGEKLTFAKPQSIIWYFCTSVVIVMTLIALSASFGISDASAGYRGSGRWEIQKVLIISPAKLILANSKLSLGCNDANCTYGPFGLIGENDHAYILIEWQKDQDGKFLRQPGLFIVPRSDSNYLIPASP